MGHMPAPSHIRRRPSMVVWEHAKARFGIIGTASNERGATSTEYALMAGFIALAIITSVALFSGRVNIMFTTYGNTLPG